MNRPSTAQAHARTITRVRPAPTNVYPMNTRGGAVEGGLRIEIVFPRPDSIVSLGAHVVGPNLDEMCAPTHGAWWFLRREAGWHLHLDHADHTHTALVLNQLVKRGIVQHWNENTPCPSSPEPGHGDSPGPGMGTEHGAVSCAGIRSGEGLDLHRVDSRGALVYLRQLHHLPENRRPLLPTRFVAGILARTVCRAAGLDRAAAAAVLDVLACRATGGLNESSRVRAHGLAEVLAMIWRVPAPRALGSSITPWVTDLAVAARGLAAATRAGELPAVEHSGHLQGQLARALAAQWDRLGMTVNDQTILAVAIRDALRNPRAS